MESTPPQASSTDSSYAAPISLIAAFGGVTKKRAAHACQSCNRRKLRCDVIDRGARCSNCTSDGLVCAVATKKARKRAISSINDQTRRSSSRPERVVVDFRISEGDHRRMNGKDVPDSYQAHPFWMNIEESEGPDEIDKLQNHDNDELEGHDQRTPPLIGPYGIVMIEDSGGEEPEKAEQAENEDIEQLHLIPSHSARHNPLASFLKPLPEHITDDDIEYMWSKGSLSIPLVSLRNELLAVYIKHIHSAFPILDMNEFLRALQLPDGEGGQLSLLLFQAVMFSATAFIEMRHLHDAGFPDRTTAQQAFLQKARVLYKLEFEPDKIAVLQALLLMTFWYDNPDNQKDLWYWMGLAASLSQALGLHETNTYETLSPMRQGLYRRIAWYSFIRDGQVALGTTRPPQMRRTHHTIPMLTMEDFSLEPIHDHIFNDRQKVAMGRSPSQQRQLASFCIETAKLCLCVSQILETQYTVTKYPHGEFFKLALLQPKDENNTAEARWRCDAELQVWFLQCTKDAHYTDILRHYLVEDDDSIMVHRTMLHSLYYTAVCALHQSPLAHTTAAEREFSYREAQQAAFEITNIALEIQRLDLVDLVPTYGSTYLLFAIMAHLRRVNSQDEMKRAASGEAFDTCRRMMQLLGERHPGAKLISQILTASIQQSSVSPNSAEENDVSSHYSTQDMGRLYRQPAQVM